MRKSWTAWGIGCCCAALIVQSATGADDQPPGTNPRAKPQTYQFPIIPDKPFSEVMDSDVSEKPKYQNAISELMNQRYDLADKPSPVKMSAGRKAVQWGVRVRTYQGGDWDALSQMTPEQIKEQNLFPGGFRPLPHAKNAAGGMVFPAEQIQAMHDLEARDLQRFDIDFDLPKHLTPEYPPPLFLTTHPELGDVTQGKVLSIKNYYDLLEGKITPVQMEGMRLLLTPFPQQQFNQTGDRKVKEPQLGVSCLDCHTNGHTNAAFHQNPDTRPQDERLRLDTVSLRGLFNQQIHGSKRSLRSVEDFTEFEQRTAYFDGDHVIAAKKGLNLPDRSSQVSMMAQMQNIIDFPPAPKLDVLGRLIPEKATPEELHGEQLFYGKAKCSICHPGPSFLDNQMHDLHLERFYTPEVILDQHNIADGPIKSFTLRGIKDSPPYLHDGRLMTLDDTVEFFNLVLSLKLTPQEKLDLTAFLRCL